MKSLQVITRQKSYPIYIAPSSLSRLPELLKAFSLHRDLFIVSDRNVAAVYGEIILKTLRTQDFTPQLLIIETGEESKSLEKYQEVITQLIQRGATRRSTLLALGGGVIGDLAGFVAATFMRGIRWVQIPTTLLAQIDSSVGGKVGVNHPLGKNLIGAFYHPDLVLIDPETLRTLPPREIFAGAAEMVKYGLIQDAKLFSHLQKDLETLLHLSQTERLVEMIHRCCAIKAKIVEQDEREQGLRAVLNFGHTIGHALEAATCYQYYRHGEAVTLGMAAAVFISMKSGRLSPVTAEEIYPVLRRLKPPAVPKEISIEDIQENLKYDKKRLPTAQQWVLLQDIGSFVITPEVAESLVKQAIQFMIQFSHGR